MFISKKSIGGCCGNKGSIQTIYLEKPVNAGHISFFKNAGYIVPEQYLKTGIFYVRRDGLVASSTFGSNKITVRSNSANREEKIKSFEETLETALSSK